MKIMFFFLTKNRDVQKYILDSENNVDIFFRALRSDVMSRIVYRKSYPTKNQPYDLFLVDT